MKTITYCGITYQVVRVDQAGVVADLPTGRGHVFRTVLPLKNFRSSMQARLRRLITEPRTPEILQALNESIEHWERLATGTRRPAEGISSHNCALCQLFNYRLITACVGCPIRKRTGLKGCVGTPFRAASDALDATIERKGGTDYNDPTFLAAAQVELDFLRSLLPAPPTP